MTFTAGANGSATIAGTPQAGTAGSYPITLTATNAISSMVQAFVLTVDTAPVFTSAATTTFSMGQPGSFTVTVGGARPVTAITRSGALPTGVTFTYNGGGTAAESLAQLSR